MAGDLHERMALIEDALRVAVAREDYAPSSTERRGGSPLSCEADSAPGKGRSR